MALAGLDGHICGNRVDSVVLCLLGIRQVSVPPGGPTRILMTDGSLRLSVGSSHVSSTGETRIRYILAACCLLAVSHRDVMNGHSKAWKPLFLACDRR